MGDMTRIRAPRSSRNERQPEGPEDEARLTALAELAKARSARHRRIPLLAAVILLLAGTTALTTWRAEAYASDTASAQAFQDAPACDNAATAGPNCVVTLPTTVERAWTEDKSDYYVELSGNAPANGTVQLTSSWFFDTGIPDTAAEVWRGRLVELRVIDQEFYTFDAPGLVTDRDLDWLVATALWSLFAVTLLVAAFTPLRRWGWRFVPAMLAGGAALSFTFGALVSHNSSDIADGIPTAGTAFCGISVVIVAVVVGRKYRQRRL